MRSIISLLRGHDCSPELPATAYAQPFRSCRAVPPHEPLRAGTGRRRDASALGRMGALLGCALMLAVIAEATNHDAASQLKAVVDRVLQILQDPAFKGEAKAAQRRTALRKAAEDIFDFPEMARRAMGSHWRSLMEPQRREFTQLFGELVERSYIGKIEQYKGEPIRYTGAQVQGDLATVSTRIVIKNGSEVPIDYRMFERGGRWLVYDVNIEGVSLVNNYRTQFNSIMQTSSYAELVRKMKSRLDDLRKES